MKISVSVRHATIEDAADFARIHPATWQAAYRDMLPANFLESLNSLSLKSGWEKEIARYQKDGNHIMLADTEHGPQGFVMFGRGREELIMPGTSPDYKLGQIYSLYVMPAFLGQGIGKTMMKTAFEVLCREKYTEVCLTTFEDNIAAHGFYERQGGVNAGVETTAEFGGKKMRSRTYLWSSMLML